MRPRRPLPVSTMLTAILVALMLTACGGGGTSSNTPGPNPPPSSNAESLFATSFAEAMPFKLDPLTGTLTALPTTPLQGSIGITAAIAADPARKFLLVPDLSNTNIQVLAVNAMTGEVTAVAGSPFATGLIGAGSITIDPTGKYVYAADVSGVKAFTFDGMTGALAALSNSPFTDGSSAISGAMRLGWAILIGFTVRPVGKLTPH